MVKNKGGNMTTVKYQNRALILNVLRNSGAVSRVDIAEKLQLTPAAITILVNDMIKEGIVKEVGQLEEEDKRSGRKKVLIDVDYNWKHVIGINIESDEISIGISNIKGEIVARKVISADKTITPQELLNRVSSECMNLLWKENILKDHILGAGVGVIGKVDEKIGISKHAYGLWNAEVPIKRILEETLDLRVVVDNNVRTLALGEIDYHTCEELASVLFIKYGPGIGGAMIINNEIYYGSSKSSGEIGHTVVEPEGEICRCGSRGCLETVASHAVIVKNAAKEFGENKTPVLWRLCGGLKGNINIDMICRAAEAGDDLTADIVRRAMSFLALAISNAVRLYDPNKVILYGEIFKYNIVIKELKDSINRNTPGGFDDLIIISKLNYRSNYIGGVALALREFFYNCGGEA